MIPILEATPTASSSGLKRMYAFFFPSGRINVFTALGLMCRMSLKAFFIWHLLHLELTIKTKVFLSVMALLAFSVFKGCTRTENLSNFAGILSASFDRAYLGLAASLRVLGLKNLSLVLIWYFFLTIPFLADLAALEVCLSCLALDDMVNDVWQNNNTIK